MKRKELFELKLKDWFWNKQTAAFQSEMCIRDRYKEDTMKKYNLQKFAFDSVDFCDFSAAASKALAGKDMLLCIYNDDGTSLLAISGQQGLTINRSADTIEITSKASR